MALFSKGPNIARRASEQAAKNIGFRPETLDVAGIGGVSQGPGGQIQLNEDPNTGMFRNLLTGGSPDALNAAQGLTGATGGAASDALSASRGLFEQFQNFNPLDAAEERFSRLQSVLRPQREQGTSALESRLFNQGRLDSTAGARQLAEREAALSREDAGLFERQFGESEQAQNRLLQQALQSAGGGQQLGTGLFNQALQGQGAASQLSQPLLQLLGLSTDIGGARTSADIARSNAIQGFNSQQIDKGGDQGIAGGLLQLGGGALGGFLGGPAGAKAGAKIGGSLPGLFGG